jgi:cell division protein FtsI/penicillin-binding protein 2
VNRALRRISWACLAMFLLLLANTNYVQAFEASSLANEPGNARTFAAQFQYQRGPIITADGKTVAASRHVGGVYSYQRYYPDGALYAPVTGYDSLYSATGVEKAENKYLAGTDPQLAVRNLIDLITGKPKKGASVQLTLNSIAQQAAYTALKETGRQAGVVAIQPKTGAILALASNPSFDPNKLAVLDGNQLRRNDNRLLRNPQQPLLNRAISVTYPPGSTFKVVTSSTAFSSGKYTPNTNVYAPTNLKLPNTDKELINFDNLPCGNGGGRVPVIYAFTVSCNTVFGNIGMKLGGRALRQQANKFGMNDPNLRIPMPVAESKFPPVRDPALTAYSAIGQYNDTVTPLQEAMFSAAIANGGTLMKPYSVAKVTAPDLTPLVNTPPTVMGQAVSSQVASQVKSMMIDVVKQPYGTAHESAYLPDIPIAAKTGTAQNGLNNTGLDDAVFTCFAPVDNPQIAIGVVVKGGGLGADEAAPVAVKIIQAYMKYLASQEKR